MKVIDTTKSDVTANDQSEKEIQNSVKPKTALQKKVNNNGLTQRMNRGISLNKSSSVHKPKFKLSAARSQKRVIYHKRKGKPKTKYTISILQPRILKNSSGILLKRELVLQAAAATRPSGVLRTYTRKSSQNHPSPVPARTAKPKPYRAVNAAVPKMKMELSITTAKETTHTAR